MTQNNATLLCEIISNDRVLVISIALPAVNRQASELPIFTF